MTETEVVMSLSDLEIKRIFNGWIVKKKGNKGKINVEEVKRIMAEKGKVSAMLYLTRENNMTVSGAKALVERIEKLRL